MAFNNCFFALLLTFIGALPELYGAQAPQSAPSILNKIRTSPSAVNIRRNVLRIMALLNPKVGSVKVEEIIDSRFIRKLDETGFIGGAYSGSKR